MKTYKVGSLFAGVGGVCLGFQEAKFRDKTFTLTWANEKDPAACMTYAHNFSHTLVEGDITEILAQNTPESKMLNSELFRSPVNVITGGFPCQSFSVAGHRKGFDDERGNLFWSIIETVNQHNERFGVKPEILFLENVKNLVGHDHGKTFNVIKQELGKLGYFIRYEVLNTMEYSSLPQNRERIYIVGFLKEEMAESFTFPQKLNPKKEQFSKNERSKQTRKLLSEKVNEKYYYTKSKYPQYFLTEDEHIQQLFKGGQKARINLAEEIIEQFQFYQLRRGMYVRQNKSNVCPTLTANMGTGGHNVPLILDEKGVRKITPEEAFKLQGFPVGENYELPTVKGNRPYPDGELYKQAGNAVSVPVITALATEILKVLP